MVKKHAQSCKKINTTVKITKVDSNDSTIINDDYQYWWNLYHETQL